MDFSYSFNTSGELWTWLKHALREWPHCYPMYSLPWCLFEGSSLWCVYHWYVCRSLRRPRQPSPLGHKRAHLEMIRAWERARPFDFWGLRRGRAAMWWRHYDNPSAVNHRPVCCYTEADTWPFWRRDLNVVKFNKVYSHIQQWKIGYELENHRYKLKKLHLIQ